MQATPGDRGTARCLAQSSGKGDVTGRGVFCGAFFGAETAAAPRASRAPPGRARQSVVAECASVRSGDAATVSLRQASMSRPPLSPLDAELLEAAKAGNVSKLRELRAKGASVEAKDRVRDGCRLVQASLASWPDSLVRSTVVGRRSCVQLPTATWMPSVFWWSRAPTRRLQTECVTGAEYWEVLSSPPRVRNPPFTQSGKSVKQHAKDDATRAVLLEMAAAKAAAKVPANIAELLAKVSVSAAAIGPRLAVSGAA